METNMFGLIFSNFNILDLALQCVFLSFRLNVMFSSEDFNAIFLVF